MLNLQVFRSGGMDTPTPINFKILCRIAIPYGTIFKNAYRAVRHMCQVHILHEALSAKARRYL